MTTNAENLSVKPHTANLIATVKNHRILELLVLQNAGIGAFFISELEKTFSFVFIEVISRDCPSVS